MIYLLIPYLLGAVLLSWLLRKYGGIEFEGNEILDYIFRGFVSCVWPVLLPVFLIGRFGGK